MVARVLHIQGAEEQGGAAQAARSVRELLADWDHEVLAVWARRHQSAFREVGGYCDPEMATLVRREIGRVQPALVHLHRFGPAGTAAIRAARDEGVPVIYSAYDYWALGPCANLYSPRRACDGRCVRCYRPKESVPRVAHLALLGRRRRIVRHLNECSAIVALCRDQRRRLQEAGVTAPIHVVPVPVSVLDLGSVARVPRRVLSVGWLAPNKGQHVVVEAVRRLREQGVACELRLIGPRAHPGYLQPMPEWVDWRGPQTREAVLREIAAASVLVCAEQWPNPQPLVLCEAMLLGTPVVASGVGGIPELFYETNADGALCPPNRSDAFAEVLMLMLQRRALGALVPQAVRDYFDPDRLRTRLQEVYRSCLT